MFWAGFFIGLVLGIGITVVVVRFSIDYVVKHEELFDQMLNNSFKQFSNKVERKTENFFMDNSLIR